MLANPGEHMRLGFRLADRVIGHPGSDLTLSWEDGVPQRAVLGLGPVRAH